MKQEYVSLRVWELKKKYLEGFPQKEEHLYIEKVL